MSDVAFARAPLWLKCLWIGYLTIFGWWDFLSGNALRREREEKEACYREAIESRERITELEAALAALSPQTKQEEK